MAENSPSKKAHEEVYEKMAVFKLSSWKWPFSCVAREESHVTGVVHRGSLLGVPFALRDLGGVWPPFLKKIDLF